MRQIRTSIPFWVLSTTVVLAVWAGARGDLPAGPELGRADFRYAPPWWQSAICLPDDPDKILVGKEGQVLLEFGQGGVRNFGIVLQPEIDSGTTWVKQQTISPRAPIVQTFQGAGGVELLEETFVVIPRSDSPAARPRIVRADTFFAGDSLPARRVVVLVTLRNSTTEEAKRRPELRILSGKPVRSDQAA